MASGIRRLLKIARENVHNDIVKATDRNSKYSVGLAYEGYRGGYLAALQDVELALNGAIPSRNGWWEKNED
jgi:hypothetical protein